MRRKAIRKQILANLRRNAKGDTTTRRTVNLLVG